MSRNWDLFTLEKRIYELEQKGTPTPSSWDYSTTETDTLQKWVDDKEIYCRVIIPESSITLEKNEWTKITLSDGANIDTLIDVKINFQDSVTPATLLGGEVPVLIQKASDGFYYYNTLATGTIEFIILKYTKVSVSKKRGKK